MTKMLGSIILGLIAGLGSIVTGLGDNALSYQEIVTAVLATLVAFAAAYGITVAAKAGGQ